VPGVSKLPTIPASLYANMAIPRDVRERKTVVIVISAMLDFNSSVVAVPIRRVSWAPYRRLIMQQNFAPLWQTTCLKFELSGTEVSLATSLIGVVLELEDSCGSTSLLCVPYLKAFRPAQHDPQ
jgi:hypothetical protein